MSLQLVELDPAADPDLAQALHESVEQLRAAAELWVTRYRHEGVEQPA